MRVLNWLGVVRETMRAALNPLAVAPPTGLVAHADPAGADRYDDEWRGPGRRLTENGNATSCCWPLGSMV